MRKRNEVTIYDIARKLDLSPATVSRGLNDHPGIKDSTKKRINRMAEKLGYRVNTFASNLRRQRSNTLGVIVPRLNSEFMSKVLSEMEKVANEAGYNLIISQSLETVEKEIANTKTMFNSRVDGLLVSLAYDTKDLSHINAFVKAGIPLVFFDRMAEHLNVTSVIIDNYKAGYEVTNHLIEQGCINIIHITANQLRNVYRDRLRGYKQALLEHDIPFDKNCVIITDLSEEAGVIIAKKILAMDKLPDGIFVANDACAVSCMMTLKEAGIHIPRDIAVAGFNNSPISRVIVPKLTTVNYPARKMGEVAMNKLINYLNGTTNINETNTVILHSELIVRNSTMRKSLVHKNGK
ncbi:MAG TPA: LacI family DNA-binding transcriptional regulator [Balneolales bacterium]|nr:LacI family DNA-binding transcriptional regulator [Balneolales bacterium]